MSTSVVLFTRDLRVHDHPALAATARGSVVPLFVIDDRLSSRSANRTAFLLGALEDLQASLAARGASLVIRRGDAVPEAIRIARRVGAEAIHLSGDVSGYGRVRERRLRRAAESERIAVRSFPGVTIVPPGELTPADSDHYRVFTPYWRRWAKTKPRPLAETPERLRAPAVIDAGRIPALHELTSGAPSPDLPPAGEGPALERLAEWRDDGLDVYHRRRDSLGEQGTSHLSPYLRFGCLSPRLLLAKLPPSDGADELARQLCWRDFFAQLLYAHPRMRSEGLNERRSWNEDPDALDRWRAGDTGIRVVDAAMRQLRKEGWMPNRARLIAAGYLTKALGIDWREGERHFFELLVDGDPANNAGNWQWVAGVGVGPRRRGFNARRQAARFDPDGSYARRYADT
jgi:deoxyribodipyrimidine photo-lyase